MSAKHQESRISGHIRSNVLAYVAVFIALGGTAWAGTKVGADDIKDDAVLQKHISPNAIGSPQIASAAIRKAEVAANAVGSDEIDNDAIKQKHLGGGIVGSNQIADGSVQQKDLGGGIVGSNQIADGSVQQKHLGGGIVGSNQIADGSVGTSDMAKGAITSPSIGNQAVAEQHLSFDIATQAELDSHKASADHDGRYFTETELSTSDGSPPNAIPGNRVHWDILTGMPTGFADGVDDTGGPSNDLSCSGCVDTADIADTAVTLAKLAFDPATQAELDSHKSQLSTSDGSPPNTGPGNRVHWDNLLGVPAGFVDGVDDSTGGGWSLTGNAGTNPATNFLGTTDNVAFNLRVNNARGLRLEPASDGTNVSPNVIGGIADNTVTAGVHSATIGGGGRLLPDTPGSASEVTDDFGTIGGGANNQAGDNAGTVSDTKFATVGGGVDNLATGAASTVSAGTNNAATADRATVGGGATNQATADRATVAGGGTNLASGLFATVGGGQSNTATDIHTTVAGGNGNDATQDRATVGGGRNNTANAVETTVSGGDGNTAGNLMATVGGGSLNTASGAGATIGGGSTNTASAAAATIAGGSTNTATHTGTTVGGGGTNHAIANGATVSGGANNVASGNNATVAGGAANVAAGDFSFLTGQRAKNSDAAHDGVFLFADSSNFNFTSTAANEFAVRSTGGARVVTAIDGTTGDPTAGVKLDPGDTAWEVLSDRAAKENLVAVSPEEILERLATVPITQWNYKAQDDSIRHIGPMAQDFHRAFGLSGDDRTHLSPIDTDGVALAAIQGLNERFDEFSAPSAGAGGSSGLEVNPAALAAIAVLALTLAATMGAAVALRWRPQLR